MTKETIQNNIDRKIQRYLEDDMAFGEIVDKLTKTKNTFEDLLRTDTNSPSRTSMMEMYVDFSKKRITDLSKIALTFAAEQNANN